MNTILKLFLMTVFLCKVDCGPYVYRLPDNDEIKSLNVTVNFQGFYVFRVECNNYNSLKYLKLRTGDADYGDYEFQSNKFTFVNCFNNETDNENYNFNLMQLLQMYRAGEWSWSSAQVSLIPYAIVNSDVLFGNYPFNRFHDVIIKDVGFTSTIFLNTFECRNCELENTNQINFNDFNVSHKIKDLRISKTKLFNLNSVNTRKFNLTKLMITQFSLDDYNTFNVPGVFEQQMSMKRLELKHSDGRIVLHGNVFRGLKSLVYISLEYLQLDSIPPNMFNDMEKLVKIKLNSNNIKVLATSFEFNIRLTEIQLKANPIFSEPHDRIDQLVIGGYMLRLHFENYTIHTRDTVKKLINNGRIDSITFESLETDLRIQDFLNMESDRSSSYLGIEFKNYPSGYLDWDYLKTNGIACENSFDVNYELRDNFNVQIRLPISGEACHNCNMMKKFFRSFLTNSKNPGFYFEHSRALLKFERTCTNQIEYFDKQYTENCVPACKCIHNPLADQIIIDCRNRNLTEFPVIPYPVQYDYDTIYTIDLLFENNLLAEISFSGQDERVLTKMATLNFSNNRIKSFTMATNFNQVKSLNLCANPILDDIKSSYITLYMSGISYEFSSYLCMNIRPAHHSRFSPAVYVEKTKSAIINEYLNKIKC